MKGIILNDDYCFLTQFEEEQIKLEYEKEKSFNKIDKDLIPILDNINSIDGLTTLYSCQGHLDKPRSYLVLKFSESLVYPITESIWELITEHNNLTVDWECSVSYPVDGILTSHEVIIIRGNMNYNYMHSLFNKLN